VEPENPNGGKGGKGGKGKKNRKRQRGAVLNLSQSSERTPALEIVR
jgi:hypothetical protein